MKPAPTILGFLLLVGAGAYLAQVAGPEKEIVEEELKPEPVRAEESSVETSEEESPPAEAVPMLDLVEPDEADMLIDTRTLPSPVEFYDLQVNAECIVWVLDCSGSMAGQPIKDLKQQAVDSITRMDPKQYFSIVCFNSTTESWRPKPVPATFENKQSAKAFVQKMFAESWTCLKEALDTAFAIKNRSDHKSKTIVLLSDGSPFCDGKPQLNEIRRAIKAQGKKDPIYGVYVGHGSSGWEFLKEIVNTTGGQFVRVDWADSSTK